MGTNSFIQVPPDGAGKKIFSQSHSVEGSTVYTQVYNLSDPDSPTNIQKVDIRGQALTGFFEGSPTIDAFGNLRVGENRIIGGYEYTHGDMADLFTDYTAVGASITHIDDASEVHLATTDQSGSTVTRTTNRYHYYQPGVGTLIIMTLANSDSGKANNVRRWGYFDENNGLFFELSGTTLNVVLRSSTTGIVTEQRISRANWNRDKLDGTGISGMSLDLTKANFFWIDFAWLGVGIARLGVLAPDGSRWPVHIFENPNSNITAYMATGSLPIRYENYNTALTAGSSNLKLICSAVYAQSTINYTFWRFDDTESSLKSVTTNTPVLSMKPKLLDENGNVNRVGIYPSLLSVYVVGGNIKLTIVDDGTLTNATWAITSEGSVIADDGATAITGGSKFYTVYLGEGCHNIDLEPIYEINDEGYHVLADGSDAYTMSFVATKLSGNTVQCKIDICYRELR